MMSKGRIFGVLGSGLLLAIVAGGLFLLVNKNNTQSQQIVVLSSPTPTIIPTPSPTPESPLLAGIKRFTSNSLGISFDYQESEAKVLEAGNKVFIYPPGTKPENGQSVEVFNKDPKQTLSEAVKQRFLTTNYFASDCLVKDGSLKNSVQIVVPMDQNDSLETLSVKWDKCPPKYTTQNGLSYFLTDPAYPDKFIYLSIGQYAIPGPNNDPWQDSLKFIK